MKLNALFILVLFWAIFRVTSKSLKFEKLTRFTSVVIPIYSVIMFIVTMIWNLKNFIVLLFLFIVSIFIAIFQVSKVEFKETTELDKHDRPVVYIRKGYPYLLGWIIIILVGVGCSALFESLTASSIFKEIFSEIKGELLVYSTFSQQKNWYIWLLSGTTSFLYTEFLKRKNPLIKEALQKNKNLIYRSTAD
ncbi:hypothetical protein [Oenococcus oeni]|uniref:Hydrophobic protein n=6 Tax=Oenococcus oeni TaxID=1247 RepID=Q04E98_OENOB|nr:hypothetical protein [Oenococcus oeni]ABJ57224.1 hypothetical protein OEOE_1357 [Oenococcus oeni PSU-1]KGH54886.1 hypothetical protein X463_07845 [Oenococcus oeni S22]AWW99231.1 hypothetical protein C5H79_06900 [Oenococcus oeni]EFD88144.1 hypothetical protein AWRIB429_1361 [Oenococcus oeni AWRIB429]EJN92188.1 hypothetical protein AWRIB304_1082 [Oenococcus oeni AWRIB304]